MPPTWWGAPLQQINNRARACDLSDRSEKIKERKKRQERAICMTSYTAQWNRIENEERKFYHEVEKEKIAREEKLRRLK